MNISKDRLKQLLEYAFRQGMNDGYGIDHENITEEENKACEEFLKSVNEIKLKFRE